MTPLVLLCLAILWAATAYLIALGMVAIFRPRAGLRFLSGFAQTPLANGFEAAARAAVGTALVALDGRLGGQGWAAAIGGFLIVTAALMLLLPGLHRRLAPRLVRSLEGAMRPFGAASLLLGGIFAVVLLRSG